jgi:hypothetical protein
MAVRYVCEGSCGGFVSEEEYKPGQTCAAESCEKHGHPLVRKETKE